MNGKLLNSTEYQGKTYTLKDVNGFVDIKAYQLGDNFYGGRVRNFGKVDSEEILLCVEKEKVIDIFVPEGAKEVDLTELSRDELIEYAKKVGVQGRRNTMSNETLIDEIEKVRGAK